MTSCPVPYFSNLAATATGNKTESVIIGNHLIYNPCKKNVTRPSAYKPFLGLPSSSPYAFRRTTNNTVDKNKLREIFPDNWSSTTSQDICPQQPNSILAQASTPAIVEKQLVEINRTNFLNLAAVNTVESLAKATQKRFKQTNPLKPSTNFGTVNIKKRKKDIFDNC